MDNQFFPIQKQQSLRKEQNKNRCQHEYRGHHLIFSSKATNFEKRTFKNDFLHYFCSKMELC